MIIAVSGRGEPISFAGAELQRCLVAMTGGEPDIRIELGLFSDFSIEPAGKTDEILVDIQRGSGRIAASAQTCLLFAVYSFLRECGATWVRPGRGNEYLPKVEPADMNVSLRQSASYRHRGVCIEGAVSLENVLDIVDWLPKLGFNAYFIQFREAHVFFARWYEHRKNELLEGTTHTVERSRQYTRIVSEAVKARGLKLHMTGHGWTCEPFGIPGLSWDAVDFDPPEEVKRHFALVNGKRGLWGGKPMNTNLCFSNPETRKKLVSSACVYLRDNPQIDVLHLWLSDGTNNVCECDECNKLIPSDFYVMLLNELDERLTSEGIPTRIVFLIYVDLLWAPEKYKLVNQDRFILMFAPITRTYSRCFSADKAADKLPPYVKNHLIFPESVEENLAFLNKWQQTFSGDSFIFDYHLMWDHYKELGYYNCARTIHDDMVNLRELGLDGNVSCQLQRLFVPNALPMVTLARTLWNRQLSFEEISEQYLRDTYGDRWAMVRDYLIQVSDLYSPDLLRLERNRPDPGAADGFLRLQRLACSRKPLWASLAVETEPRFRESFRLLQYHAGLLERMCEFLHAFALRERDLATVLWEKAKLYIQENETEYQYCLDVFEFITTYEDILKRDSREP